MRLLTLTLLFASIASVWPTGVLAQDGWNESRVLELVTRARAERTAVITDDSLRSYAADARGYVYFYVDRRDAGETALVKTDQIALEVYWKAPDSTKQRIVGLRDEESLPTNIQYHLDHLTVVQDDYADVIRMGDGDEVSAVLHPMAPGSEQTYDFRLADSISINLGGGQPPVRVYEIEVRPRDFTRPGIIGSVFLDRASAAIVRMNFTFTAASYVDDYLDYIRISLDNSLWDGRYWLPYEQRVELRRELPYLDFPAGSVIRGRYEIRNYRFNEEFGPLHFLGGRISALPRERREAFPFEEGLHDQLDEEGLGPIPELADIRAEAARMAGRQMLSGLGRWRPWVPSGSWVSRRNRAEGSAFGLGMAYRARDDLRLASAFGYAFGSEKPYATARIDRGGRTSVALVADWNALGEIGGRQTASTTLNTFAVAIADRDYLDPFFTSGARFEVRHARDRVAWTGEVGVHRHRSASLVTLDRPIRAVDEGTLGRASIGVQTTGTQGFGVGLAVDGGRLTGRSFGGSRADLWWRNESVERGHRMEVSSELGWTSSDSPLQDRALLGGRGTLIGYPYRSFAGDRWSRVHFEASQVVAAPWVRLGVFGSAATSWLRDNSVPESWAVAETGQVRYSAGFTAHVLWELVRIDVGRGLNGGSWQAHVSLARRFWNWL